MQVVERYLALTAIAPYNIMIYHDILCCTLLYYNFTILSYYTPLPSPPTIPAFPELTTPGSEGASVEGLSHAACATAGSVPVRFV